MYITFLNGNKGSGPTYSVPRQISAQSEFDNVFWYDVCHSRMTGTDRLFNYYDLSAYPEGTIAALPEPFWPVEIVGNVAVVEVICVVPEANVYAYDSVLAPVPLSLA